MDMSVINSLVVDNLDASILLLDNELLITSMNPAAQSLFGASARKVLGHRVSELFYEADEFMSAVQRAHADGDAFTDRELSIVLPVTHKKITVDCTFTPLSVKGNRLILLELRRIDRMLRIAREGYRLAQQNAMKILVRGLAHEVKNPLGGLRGAAQLLEKELHSEELKEYTNIIIGEADRLQNLVDDMLGPNKLLRKTTFNVHEILERVRQLVLAEASGELEIARDYDPSIPDLYADSDRMIQAVLNIVRNASQALQGRGCITMRTRALRQFTIGTERHRLVLKLEIIDNGPGIPADMVEQIFYPMVTSRPEGTGLGLSIAQTIVSQHDGLIECVSEPGNTDFILLLPIVSETKTT